MPKVLTTAQDCWREFSCSWWKIILPNLSLNQTEPFWGDIFHVIPVAWIYKWLHSDVEHGGWPCVLFCKALVLMCSELWLRGIVFSLGHSSGSQDGGANTTSGPIRKPQIPGKFGAVEPKTLLKAGLSECLRKGETGLKPILLNVSWLNLTAPLCKLKDEWEHSKLSVVVGKDAICFVSWVPYTEWAHIQTNPGLSQRSAMIVTKASFPREWSPGDSTS